AEKRVVDEVLRTELVESRRSSGVECIDGEVCRHLRSAVAEPQIHPVAGESIGTREVGIGVDGLRLDMRNSRALSVFRKAPIIEAQLARHRHEAAKIESPFIRRHGRAETWCRGARQTAHVRTLRTLT